MNHLIYCTICRIPIKTYEYPKYVHYKFCGHDKKFSDESTYLSESLNVERWNLEHPERQINNSMILGHSPSPYKLNDLALLLQEAEESIK